MSGTPDNLCGFSESQRSQALERFSILEPFVRDGVPLPQIAETSQVPLRTLRTWVARYRSDGLAGLTRRVRSDRGSSRFPTELRQLVEGLALKKPAPTAASVHRKVKRVAATKTWPVPSYRAIAAIIQELDPGLTTLAHCGTKAYEEAFDLIHRREASCPNEIWQADHTPLDIWVFDERQEPARPWFTAILDDYSRAVAGWRLSFQAPSAFQTALTLRQAIWRKEDSRWHVCGIPEILYTDHGSDFRSQHLEQVAADLKFQPIFSAVGKPRGRGRIERFFKTVNQLFLSELPGYTPPKAMPAPPSLTIRELEAAMTAFLLDDYHRRVHSETGCSPQARWEAGGFLPQLPESIDQLDLLLLTVARQRSVRRDGIHFQCLRYLDPTLAAYVGEPVVIRYDPRDLTEIRVFHKDRFLCRAICPELADQSVGLKEITAARKQRLRQLRGHLKSRTRVVDLLLEAHQPEPSPHSKPAPTNSEARSSRLRRYLHDD
ncbi:MAG: Mu transposase C-terminal domain-containing protein [Anaerolineae bacterium]